MTFYARGVYLRHDIGSGAKEAPLSRFSHSLCRTHQLCTFEIRAAMRRHIFNTPSPNIATFSTIFMTFQAPSFTGRPRWLPGGRFCERKLNFLSCKTWVRTRVSHERGDEDEEPDEDAAEEGDLVVHDFFFYFFYSLSGSLQRVRTATGVATFRSSCNSRRKKQCYCCYTDIPDDTGGGVR